LSSLILGLCIPPPLATLLLDTPVGEPWIDAVGQLETRLQSINARGRVKASRDLGEIAEALRIVVRRPSTLVSSLGNSPRHTIKVATKLRAFFLALLQPIRTNMSTNMQVLQTSVLLKYRPLFTFLQRNAADVANEIQRAYVGAARTYYETGFRRYIRCLNSARASPSTWVDFVLLMILPDANLREDRAYRQYLWLRNRCYSQCGATRIWEVRRTSCDFSIPYRGEVIRNTTLGLVSPFTYRSFDSQRHSRHSFVPLFSCLWITLRRSTLSLSGSSIEKRSLRPSCLYRHYCP